MRSYYKQRIAGIDAPKLELRDVATMFYGTVASLREQGWFQEAFGYWCVDAEGVLGTAGDADLFLYRHAFVRGLWPPREDVYINLDEATLYTLLEIFYDQISKPLEGWLHDYQNCGTHYRTFDRAEGKQHWRDQVNNYLRSYGEGVELDNKGEIQHVGAPGLRELMVESVAASRGMHEGEKISSAVRKFRLAKSTKEERFEAVRALADVLERNRSKVKEILQKDEHDLFNIANNYAIRHDNQKQKTEYGEEMLAWVFYMFLATSHLVLDLGKRAPLTPPPEALVDLDDLPF